MTPHTSPASRLAFQSLKIRAANQIKHEATITKLGYEESSMAPKVRAAIPPSLYLHACGCGCSCGFLGLKAFLAKRGSNQGLSRPTWASDQALETVFSLFCENFASSQASVIDASWPRNCFLNLSILAAGARILAFVDHELLLSQPWSLLAILRTRWAAQASARGRLNRRRLTSKNRQRLLYGRRL